MPALRPIVREPRTNEQREQATQLLLDSAGFQAENYAAGNPIGQALAGTKVKGRSGRLRGGVFAPVHSNTKFK